MNTRYTGPRTRTRRVFLATAPWSYASLAGRGPSELRSGVRRDVSGQGILPTLGMHYLAAALERSGHEVQVVDGYGYSRHAMLDAIARFAPDVVGLSTQTPLWPEAIEVIRAVKKRQPGVRIAVGGSHVNLRQAQIFEEAPEADAIFVGPAEASFLEWVEDPSDEPNQVITEARRKGELRHEPGFASHVAGRVPWGNYIPNLMFLGHKRFATSVSTMGCASGCSFCALTKDFKGRRTRPAESVLEELEFLSRERGIRTVNFMDDNTLFAARGKQADELLEKMAAARLPVEFTMYLNDFQISEERLRLMKAAGLKRVLLLAESGSQRIADLAHGRHVAIDDIARTIERVHAAGIEACARFQIGFPGETPEDAQQSVDFAMRMPLLLASFVRTLILPGSKIATKAVAAGRAPREDERWSYYGRPVPPDRMSRDEQVAIVKRAVRTFYTRQILNGRLFEYPRLHHVARRVLVDGTE